MKPLLSFLLLSLCLTAFASAADAKSPVPASAPAPAAAPLPSLEMLTDKETVDLFAAMPVQEQGRVKPLDTLARFRLLRYSGKQSGIGATDTGAITSSMGQPKPLALADPATGKPILTSGGKLRKFTAIEWLLVSWFRPDIGKDLRVFIVDNSDAVIELGLGGKGKRDRYSYNEIAPGRDLLRAKMDDLRARQKAAREERREVDFTPEERALSKLAVDFLDYEMILGHFDFARPLFAETAGSLPPELASFVKDGRVSDWGAFLPAVTAHLKDPQAGAPMQNPWMRDLIRAMLGAIMGGDESSALRNFPPPSGQAVVWNGPGTILQAVLTGSDVDKLDLAHLNSYGALLPASGDPQAFKTQARKLRDQMQALGNARGESGHVGLELHYHRADYFLQALMYFTFGTLVLALSWVKRGAGWERWTRRVSIFLLIVGALYGTTGIVVRCIIMQRPPITTLYETILFITTASVIAGLLAEWVNRKGYALTMAAVAGTIGMFLSLRFFTFEGTDSMRQLEAVLITTFWLSTHVPCINLGYAMSMVACIFSTIYLVTRLVGSVVRRLTGGRARVAAAGNFMDHGSESAREITRMAYGFVLAGLFFSLIGTVLGGIWANYSWGRFWGWDPKENGALMIVLMSLVILHARFGGYVREIGFHNLNIVLGMITIFSWFATNQLGIGLHAYGAMDGAWGWLYRVWALMAGLLVFGLIRARLDRRDKSGGEIAGTLPQPHKA